MVLRMAAALTSVTVMATFITKSYFNAAVAVVNLRFRFDNSSQSSCLWRKVRFRSYSYVFIFVFMVFVFIVGWRSDSRNWLLIDYLVL